MGGGSHEIKGVQQEILFYVIIRSTIQNSTRVQDIRQRRREKFEYHWANNATNKQPPHKNREKSLRARKQEDRVKTLLLAAPSPFTYIPSLIKSFRKMLFRSVLSALLLSTTVAQNYEADCFPALAASDENGDGLLEQETEFLAFANAYGTALYPDCYEQTDSLDLLLLGVYTALSADTCLTCSPLPSCCFNSQVSIDGAADPDRTSEQQSSLERICSSTSAVIFNCSENEPVIGVPDIDEAAFNQCLEKLSAADGNGDEIITREEFSAAFTLPSNCSAADQGEFGLVQQAAYSGIILSQCPIQDFLSCSLDTGSRNITASGLYSSSGRTADQTANLQTICALTESIQFFPCGLLDTPGLASTDCSEALSTADANGDDEISREEYVIFLNDIKDCEEEITELTIDQQATFASLACLSDLTEECLSNNSSTISLASMDNTTITSICLSSDLFGCGGVEVPGFPAPPVIGGVNTNFSGCFEDIVTADENGDSFLSLDEYYTLHVLRAGERCQIGSSLTETQRSTFEGLVCTSCVSSGAGFSCCSDVSDSSLVSIAGATNRDNQTFIQTTILVAVCASVELECINITPTVPSPPTTDSIPPAASPTTNAGLNDCLGSMTASDADGNGELNYSEFSVFVETFGQESCSSISVPKGASDLAFSTLGCSSCVANGGGLDCCTEPVENKVVVIPAEIDEFASAVCLAVNSLIESSGCGTDIESTESPSLAPIATNSSSNPETGGGGGDSSGSGKTRIFSLLIFSALLLTL